MRLEDSSSSESDERIPRTSKQEKFKFGAGHPGCEVRAIREAARLHGRAWPGRVRIRARRSATPAQESFGFGGASAARGGGTPSFADARGRSCTASLGVNSAGTG